MTNSSPSPDADTIAPQPIYENGRQKIIDEEHLKLLVFGCNFMGAVVAVYSLFGLMYVVMGIAMSHMPFPVTPPTPPTGIAAPAHVLNGPDRRLFADMMAVIGAAVVVIGWILSALIFLAGRSIARRRHVVLIQVVAALECLLVPFGTALGVCTFLVLSRKTVMALFGRPAYPGSPPAGPRSLS